MVLSRRERYVLIGTVIVVVAVVALVLDRFVLTSVPPEGLSETEAQKPDAPSEANQAETLLANRRQMAPKWREMLKSGMKGDPAAAESQVLHAIRDWAEASGLTMSLIKPDRLTEKTRLPEIAFQAAGTGTMDSVRGLLWRIQTASIPIKVTELQLTARKEGTDDLTVQLRLSTVYVPAPPQPATAPVAPPGRAGVGK